MMSPHPQPLTTHNKHSIAGDASPTSVANQLARPAHEDTCIIFDWDDTLLSSSWLASEGLRLDYPAVVPDEAVAQLKVLEASVVKLLLRAMELGDVHLVTNAETGWIELSAQRFMPAVLPLLPKLKIISARSTFEHLYPNEPHRWKVDAFRRQIGYAFDSRMDDGRMRNIISFGDSIHERDALFNVTRTMNSVYTKSVKFVERPTMEQLQRQLELVHSCFDYIITYAGELDLMLTIQLLYN